MGKMEFVTGTLINDRTVSLDEPLRLKVTATKVRVAIEPLSSAYRQPYRPEVIRKIHAAQSARGYRPPSREEVDVGLKSERESWGD